MKRAAPDPETLDAIKARCPHHARLDLLATWAQPYEVVIGTSPAINDRLPPQRRGPCGGLFRVPLEEGLRWIGHEDGAAAPGTAGTIARHPPPEGHTWVVYADEAGALAAPWPWQTDLDALLVTCLGAVRDQLVAVARDVAATGTSLDRVAVIVGNPLWVSHLVPDLRARYVACMRVDRASLGDHMAAHAPSYASLAEAIAAPVPAGHLRVLAALDADSATTADWAVPT